MRLLRITTVPISLRILLKGQLEFMAANGTEVLAVSSPGSDVASLNVPHQAVLMTRSITPIRDFLALLRLIAIILRFRPDIVHTHTPKAGLLGMLAAWMCGVPIRIHTIGGLPWLEAYGLRRWFLKRMEELTIWASTDSLVNSVRLRNILRDELPAVRRELRVLGNGSTNGIDVNQYTLTKEIQSQAVHLRSDLGIAETDFVFCFIGRLVLHKGIVELVTAFDHIRQTHPHVKLLLVGPIEDGREKLPDDLSKRIRIGEGIVLPGLVEDVRPWLAASNALVFPTYREGFPNVLMQAGCMGTPVIATNINGCNEIVSEPTMGILIPPKDSPALEVAMRSYIDSADLIGKNSETLRSHIIQKFDQKLMWGELLNFYREKISETNS